MAKLNGLRRLLMILKKKPSGSAADAVSEDSVTAEFRIPPGPQDDETRLKNFLESRLAKRERQGFCADVEVFGSRGMGKTCFVSRLVAEYYPAEYDKVNDRWFTQYDPTQSDFTRSILLCGCFVATMFQPLMIPPGHVGMIDPVLELEEGDNFYILAYNVGDRKSFDNVRDLYPRFVGHTRSGHVPRTPAWCGGMIVALACDLTEREVELQEGLDFARSIGLEYLETSAKTGTGCTRTDHKDMIATFYLQMLEKLM
jgi:hypothetical protein